MTRPLTPVASVRACGCLVVGRHRQDCPLAAERRRQVRLQVEAEIRAKAPPPPTKYKVPRRPERPSTETPIGWLPPIEPKVSAWGLASRKETGAE